MPIESSSLMTVRALTASPGRRRLVLARIGQVGRHDCDAPGPPISDGVEREQELEQAPVLRRGGRLDEDHVAAPDLGRKPDVVLAVRENAVLYDRRLDAQNPGDFPANLLRARSGDQHQGTHPEYVLPIR
jgi:hypothetical protein